MNFLKLIPFVMVATITITKPALGQSKIEITIKPKVTLIEVNENKQIVNFDFLVTNSSTDTILLDQLRVSVYDNKEYLLQRKFLDNNGTAPSILLLPKRIWEGNQEQLIFNPFSEFELVTPIHKLEYELVFTNSKDEETKVTTVVYPERYNEKVALIFPLKGKILVYDAHDYNSHHRRFDYTFRPIKSFGIKSNFMRYAYDFVLLNSENKQFKNQGEENEDYFGFGATVYAAAEGTVIYASNEHQDNKKFDVQKLKDNPLELYGNCIAIQHKDNTISVYGHLMHNSLTVKLGDTIHTNQSIAKIGTSGSSFFPHLHFEMRNAITHDAEGLPSYFKNIFLVEGSHKIKLNSGCATTGNILEIK
ncbi:M23 family metallopeptidase [Flavobacterium sp. NRK F7]|nr:M23 family metallopeptidase [Flavobacterium sp. NRK F7]